MQSWERTKLKTSCCLISNYCKAIVIKAAQYSCSVQTHRTMGQNRKSMKKKNIYIWKLKHADNRFVVSRGGVGGQRNGYFFKFK